MQEHSNLGVLGCEFTQIRANELGLAYAKALNWA